MALYSVALFWTQNPFSPNSLILPHHQGYWSPEKNSPSEDFNHPDDRFQSRYATPGFKPFSSWNLFSFRETCKVSFEHVSSLRSIYM